MSHFLTVLFIPAEEAETRDKLESYVEEQLAPFDESLEVDEYDRDCHCIGDVAQREVNARINAEFGTMENQRKSFSEIVLPDGRLVSDIQARVYKLQCSRNPDENEIQELKELDKELDLLWATHNKARADAFDKYLDEHPLKSSPNPECGFYTGERKDWWPEDVEAGDRYDDESGCGGTGTYRSTYNPDSKWDWYSIGGRWNGWLAPPEAKPEKNPRNWKKCFICNGTGSRDDALGLEARLKNPEYTCNGCGGTGKELLFPSDQVDSGYNVVTPRYIESLGLVGDLPTPRAFIDLDGQWHQKGEMGWFGVANDKMSQEEWTAHWRSELSKVNDAFDEFRVVVLDLHI